MNNIELTRGFLAKLLSLYPQQARWPQENPEDFEALVINYAPLVEELGQQTLFKRLDLVTALKRSLAEEVRFYSQALDVCFAYRGALVNLKAKYGLQKGLSSDTTVQHLLEAERKASCVTDEAKQAREQLQALMADMGSKKQTLYQAGQDKQGQPFSSLEKAEFERLMKS